jgi:hypothetical protein
MPCPRRAWRASAFPAHRKCQAWYFTFQICNFTFEIAARCAVRRRTARCALAIQFDFHTRYFPVAYPQIKSVRPIGPRTVPPPAMHTLMNTSGIAIALASLVQLILFLRWLYRRIRNDELTRAFVEDMATHHLPHIYALLELLCEQQGIDRTPLPPIRWVDLNGRRPH